MNIWTLFSDWQSGSELPCHSSVLFWYWGGGGGNKIRLEAGDERSLLRLKRKTENDGGWFYILKFRSWDADSGINRQINTFHSSCFLVPCLVILWQTGLTGSPFWRLGEYTMLYWEDVLKAEEPRGTLQTSHFPFLLRAKQNPNASCVVITKK